MSVTAVMARLAELQGYATATPPAAGATATVSAPVPALPAASAAPFAGLLASQTPAPVSDSGGFAADIDTAAARYGVDPTVLRGLIRQESGFDATATSPTGAQGLTQLMPGTASALGVTNPYDPAQAIDSGARYLREQLDRFGGDYSLALAAYNAGPGAVQTFSGIPPYPETRDYVARVLGFAHEYRTGGAP